MTRPAPCSRCGRPELEHARAPAPPLLASDCPPRVSELEAWASLPPRPRK